MPAWVVDLVYLVAAVLFVFGLKGLTRPRTAVRGNLLGSTGMLVAVVITLLDEGVVSYAVVGGGLAAGAAIGATLAVRIQMTAMPQLVALFNGFGGGASALVAAAQLQATNAADAPRFLIATAVSVLIGTVTLWGSLVAFGKLQELGPLKGVITLPGHQALNGLLTAAAVAMAVTLVLVPGPSWPLLALVGASTLLGLLLVFPIGGADMPVVIALLNSLSGLAASGTGFVLMNNGLIIAGTLVGAAGLILTAIMCRAMNRPLGDVLFGKMDEAAGPQEDIYEGRIKSTSAEEVAMLLEPARRVVFIPGYGMAVAQAQHAVRDLTHHLQERGTEVLFGIHAVAGRMPGHMNVLLAEADIPYDLLLDGEQINAQMDQTDAAIVIGANDVVNPDAREKKDSPLYGMPIIDVDKARTSVVVKRSLSPGFAGVPNPLFAADNTLMLFGDAKGAMNEVLQAMKEG